MPPYSKLRFLVATVLLGATLVLLGTFAAPVAAREWIDQSGTYRVKADLVGVRDGKAYLEKEDGNIVRVPLESLSDLDLRYLSTLPEYQEYFKEHPLPRIKPATPKAAKTAPKPQSSVIHVDDPKTVGMIRQFDGISWGVEAMEFSPNGRFLAVGSKSGSLIVYDVDKSTTAASFEKAAGSGDVSRLTFSPDGKRLLTAGRNGKIQIWNVTASGHVTPSGEFAGHSSEVKAITVSKDGRTVLSGDQEERVRCWTLPDAKERFALADFSSAICLTYITRSGKQGLASDGRVLSLIDMDAGKVIESVELSSRANQAMAVAPDGSLMVISSHYSLEGTEIRSGKGPIVFQGDAIQWTATFLPNSRFILSGGQGKVNLWSVAQQGRIYEFDVPGGGYIQKIAASPDGRHFAASNGNADGRAMVFRLPNEVVK